METPAVVLGVCHGLRIGGTQPGQVSGILITHPMRGCLFPSVFERSFVLGTVKGRSLRSRPASPASPLTVPARKAVGGEVAIASGRRRSCKWK